MTKIAEEFPMGNKDEITKEELFENLQEMYRILATAINQRAIVITRFDGNGVGIDGQTDDAIQPIGAINVNQTTSKVEVLTEHTNPSTVVWTQVS